METDFRAGANLDEQRCALTDRANYEFNLREVKAENTVQNLTKELRQQDAELCCKNQVCEKSRQEQFLLLQSYGVVKGLTKKLLFFRNEVVKLGKTRRCEVELREETYQHGISRRRKHSGH